MTKVFATLLCLSFTVTANAAIFSDDFEDGNVLDTWTKIGQVGSAAAPFTQADPNTGSLEAVNNGWETGWEQSIVGLPSSGTVELSWTVRAADDAVAKHGGILLVDSNDFGIGFQSMVWADHDPSEIALGVAPNVTYSGLKKIIWDNTLSNDVFTASATRDLAAHAVKYVYDIDAGTVDGYLDGALKASYNVSQTAFTPTALIVHNWASDARVGYDNIVVDVPEPASLALLGMGGLGMLIRRKK